MARHFVENKETVYLFLPCLADLYYPAIGTATIRVLEKAGFRVIYPREQTCCGQWAVNTGHPAAARPLARHFLAVFGKADHIVSPSGSCVLTVRNHYPELLADDPAARDLARAVGERTFELTQFLDRFATRPISSRFPGVATLHDSCHPLRGLGIKQEPRRLLAGVRGLELVEMQESETCCGFGGAFMAKHPGLSRALVDDKVDYALATGAAYLIMTEPGCLLNVDTVIKDRGAPIRALHIAQVLAGDKEADHA